MILPLQSEQQPLRNGKVPPSTTPGTKRSFVQHISDRPEAELRSLASLGSQEAAEQLTGSFLPLKIKKRISVTPRGLDRPNKKSSGKALTEARSWSKGLRGLARKEAQAHCLEKALAHTKFTVNTPALLPLSQTLDATQNQCYNTFWITCNRTPSLRSRLKHFSIWERKEKNDTLIYDWIALIGNARDWTWNPLNETHLEIWLFSHLTLTHTHWSFYSRTVYSWLFSSDYLLKQQDSHIPFVSWIQRKQALVSEKEKCSPVLII